MALTPCLIDCKCEKVIGALGQVSGPGLFHASNSKSKTKPSCSKTQGAWYWSKSYTWDVPHQLLYFLVSKPDCRDRLMSVFILAQYGFQTSIILSASMLKRSGILMLLHAQALSFSLFRLLSYCVKETQFLNFRSN